MLAATAYWNPLVPDGNITPGEIPFEEMLHKQKLIALVRK
jgi:hypothetical protein